MVLLLFAYYLTFTTNLSADVYGISAMHGYKPVELFLLASLPVRPENDLVNGWLRYTEINHKLSEIFFPDGTSCIRSVFRKYVVPHN